MFQHLVSKAVCTQRFNYMSIAPIDMAVKVLKIHLAPTEVKSEIVLKEWGLCHSITIR